MMPLEQIVAGKSVAELNAMADQLETMADIKAAATAATAKATAAKGAVKGAGALAATPAAAGVSAKAGAATSVLASSGPATIWSGKGLSLGLGLGLGAWGPVLLVAGGAAGWCLYKKFSKHYRTNVLDEPSI